MARILSREQIAAFQDFIRNFMVALSHASMYSRNHPKTLQLVDSAHASLIGAFGDAAELLVMLIDDQLIVQGVRLDEGLQVDRFVRSFKACGVQRLSIHRNVTSQEISNVLATLIKSSNKLGMQSLSHIHFGRVSLALSDHETSGQLRPAVKTASGLHTLSEEDLAVFMEIFDAAMQHRRLQSDGIYRIVRGIVNACRDLGGSLIALAPLRAMDEYSFTHSINVCTLNLVQAMALGLDGAPLHDVGVSGILHDIGKLFIPPEVLCKPGNLDAQEWDIVRRHPLKGAQYLLDAPGVPRLAVIAAFEHHMRHDLSGYPKVSSDWRLNMCSEMTMISDYFDAMRTRRTYRDPIELEAIIRTMKGHSGTALNPVLTENFLKVIDKLNEEKRICQAAINEDENEAHQASASITVA